MADPDVNDQSEKPDPLTVGQLLTLKDLAAEYGLSYNSLRGYAIRGRLRAKKFGYQWATTRQAVEDYLASRHLENIPKKYRSSS